MKHASFRLADFVALRRQLPAARIPRLVADVEQAYRAALGVEALTDDAIAVAALGQAGQTAFERAGLAVIRICIAYREASPDDRHLWLDHLSEALAAADPDRILGTEQRGRSRTGAAKAKATLQEAAGARDKRLLKAAQQIRKAEPRIKDAALAAMLADQGHGGREAIRKKLSKLLPPKKSVETH